LVSVRSSSGEGRIEEGLGKEKEIGQEEEQGLRRRSYSIRRKNSSLSLK
jgi:hypothetical protein